MQVAAAFGRLGRALAHSCADERVLRSLRLPQCRRRYWRDGEVRSAMETTYAPLWVAGDDRGWSWWVSRGRVRRMRRALSPRVTSAAQINTGSAVAPVGHGAWRSPYSRMPSASRLRRLRGAVHQDRPCCATRPLQSPHKPMSRQNTGVLRWSTTALPRHPWMDPRRRRARHTP
jgi:hypothetical protein